MVLKSLNSASLWRLCALLCLVVQACLTLCKPMVCRRPGSFVHGDSPNNNARMGCHALLQGIFPIQGSNSGLQHCRRILYLLSHKPKPKNTGVGSLSLLLGIFPTQELNQGLLHCRRILYQLSCQGSPHTDTTIYYLNISGYHSENLQSLK